MNKCRHIDTAGLPKGYDAADLIAGGISGEKFLEWCKGRVKDGPPPEWDGPKQAAKKKTASKKTAARKPASKTSGEGNVVPLRKPKADEHFAIPPAYSEDNLAEKFSAQFDNSLIYVAPWGAWMMWEDNRWQPDETGAVLDLSRKICKLASTEVLNDPSLGAKRDRIANTISSRKMFANVAAISQTDRRHAALPSQFDADPWALNTPDGIVDLRTGQLRPARREDFASKSAAVGPGKPSKTWAEFLKRCTDGDDDLQAYLARLAGYCITGSVAEHSFFFCYGTGGNGKGTFVNTLDWILADYARVSNMDTFTEQRFAKHSAEIAYFQGARLVTAQETEEGKRWNESRIKAMTGGDPITANYMHKNPFTFQPTFKLLFSGNHKPALRNIDEAMKRRLHLVPFEVKVPPKERDILLPEKLRAEAAGILSWAIDGCLDWQENTLDPPERVLATTKEYFENEDILATFFADRCELGALYRINTTGLYKAYAGWAEATGEYVLSRKRFIDMLKLREYPSVNRGGQMVVEGVRLQQTDEEREQQSQANWMD